MKITFATILLCAWFVAMPVALIGAIWTGVRKGRQGIVHGLVMLLGSLLLFGFVSGVIGLYEINDYARSLPFWSSIALGLIGLTLIGLGIKGALKSPSRKAGSKTS